MCYKNWIPNSQWPLKVLQQKKNSLCTKIIFPIDRYVNINAFKMAYRTTVT